MTSDLPVVPAHLRPRDGRFGCGPSRIRERQIEALSSPLLMGTSHRQAPVRGVVGDIRRGLAELFSLPEGWTVVLGNGGTTAFWAVATASLVRRRAAHAVFGEFGQKFADETCAAPFLSPSVQVSAPAGSVAVLSGDEGAASADGPAPDVFAYPHHETSTGALSPVYRPSAPAGAPGDALTLVDATSIAAGADVDVSVTDAYYFAPQKCLASDGGLWIALLSPAARKRARELHGAPDRWVPQFLDLQLAIQNSEKDQTLNTPAIATLVMLREQIRWMLDLGGLPATAARSRACSDLLYRWAERSEVATPFVAEPRWRSPVVVTLDFAPQVDAARLARALRASGIVDVEPYRKLRRNQLRIATFPATDIADVEALLASIDWLLPRL